MVIQRTRDYELVLVLRPEANEEDINATISRVDNFITSRGGTIGEHENWGVRKLAYPIRKFIEGHYILTRFSLDPRDVIELDRNLKTSEDVLRHLVVKR